MGCVSSITGQNDKRFLFYYDDDGISEIVGHEKRHAHHTDHGQETVDNQRFPFDPAVS
jgi:hypothetical protein